MTDRGEDRGRAAAIGPPACGAASRDEDGQGDFELKANGRLTGLIVSEVVPKQMPPDETLAQFGLVGAPSGGRP